MGIITKTAIPGISSHQISKLCIISDNHLLFSKKVTTQTTEPSNLSRNLLPLLKTTKMIRV